MANTVTGKVRFGYEAGVLIAGGAREAPARIKGIYWGSDQTAAADIAAADDILFSDANGNRVWGKRAASDGDGEYVPFPGGLLVNGLTVTTIDGGYFYVYLY